jgi:alkylation response protein AidB-like acyl-CoA dehydrogenase
MTDTASQSAFVAAVHAVGPRFAERAAAHDRSGEFVSDNYKLLREHKFFSAGIPRDLGGQGASHAELCDMLRELAGYCSATALALSMHTHLVSAAVWRHLHGQPAAPLLTKVAEGQLVLVSTGAGDWIDSNGSAQRADGGYRISGQKRFASGCPVGNMLMTSAPYDDPEQGPIVMHFAVPLNAEGVSIGNDWDTLGMRATGSHTVTLENVFVPDGAISVKRPRGQWHPSFGVITAIALPLVSSVYLGVAESAAKIAREAAKSKLSEPSTLYLIGEMENALMVAQMTWRDQLAAARDYAFVPTDQIASASLSRKTILAEHVDRCVRKAVEASGGSAFYRKNPLERLWRDVQGVHYHPLPEKKQLLFTGRVSLGLPPM